MNKHSTPTVTETIVWTEKVISTNLRSVIHNQVTTRNINKRSIICTSSNKRYIFIKGKGYAGYNSKHTPICIKG